MTNSTNFFLGYHINEQIYAGNRTLVYRGIRSCDQQLRKLPVQTQEVLKLAACIGNQFDLATLAIVDENSP
ncbi:hypothetical protein [Microcoleus sp. Pol10D4]|uniref:hypothetical protein n=1 Tax=Microcoleus sp. Pol10D4 TaxID=3055387 RepID=UPI002FD46B2C